MSLYNDLVLALKEYDLIKVEILLKYITNINEIDNQTGHTVLYHACLLDFSHGVELLLKAGANPNIFNDIDDRLLDNYYTLCFLIILLYIFNSSPLLIAATKGYTDIVHTLISFDLCDINITNRSNSTPLLLAIMNGYYDIVTLLINSKANLNCIDKDGNNIIHHAIDKEDVYILDLLLNHHMINDNIINHQDKYGNTSIFWAITKGNIFIINMLIKANANINICNNYGEKPMDIAENHEIRNMLLKSIINE